VPPIDSSYIYLHVQSCCNRLRSSVVFWERSKPDASNTWGV